MFQSKRINLRKFTIEDISTYHNWRNDMQVMAFTNPTLDVYSFNETEQFCQNIINSSSSKSYIIEEKDSKKPIGITSLINIDPYNRNAECIIDIGDKDYWGNGFGYEALEILLNYAFQELNLHRIYLRVFSFNERAIKLYEKLGFEHEGCQKEAIYRNGKWNDILFLAKLNKGN
ncbi:GNAT family N-acetyltransferase [Bacillus cereus group sp. MYBK108-2]|uniref:GNAT family N-acetyltransferase n=1 Tax=Bacillus cereus group TaxID=86661 RepID=UPI000B4A69ED|nr:MULTISPECIES: GNAT family protein [Bacillus cereus group]QFQ28784.1 GNAT family N-acetyltransferase [Bacillus thuringiensis]WJX08086.1 GNAT family protein [Bacillus cereus]HEF1900038.1 GNAT family N-acetyltransferase [Bacillus cereus]